MLCSESRHPHFPCLHAVMPEPAVPRTLLESIQFYASGLLLLTAIFTLSAFLFLIPFVLDPAYSTIAADFIDEPVECQVLQVESYFGLSNCTWTSCREGCTRELTACTQIIVRYTSRFQGEQEVEANDTATGGGVKWDLDSAELYVNVKGCGYPPTVNCTVFAESYGEEGLMFPCFYSRKNPRLVVPEYDPEGAKVSLVSATVFPILIFTISVTGLCLMYVRACREPVLKRLEKTRAWQKFVMYSNPPEPPPSEQENRESDTKSIPKTRTVKHEPNIEED
ncbi:unnamed protein product [Darwinula stevensoni]|uniref:Protein tipE n=1 Tax=Darwinula stevensoni TaxID=69355 RepID=A0A7R9FQL7_9CRUS|nr:unnamed protein product [Darwinula stevensoni]CAG0899393.1 unnamed protein product [Darwinula stevensoni]